jgi:hypothetical protein
MNSYKIVVHVMKTDGVSVIFNSFAKSIRQPRKPPHAHSHSEVLPLDVSIGDLQVIAA